MFATYEWQSLRVWQSPSPSSAGCCSNVHTPVRIPQGLHINRLGERTQTVAVYNVIRMQAENSNTTTAESSSRASIKLGNVQVIICNTRHLYVIYTLPRFVVNAVNRSSSATHKLSTRCQERKYFLPNTHFLELTNQNTNIHTKIPKNKNR